MKISALNRKLRRAFGGRVTATLEDNCIVLRGELGRWREAPGLLQQVVDLAAHTTRSLAV